MREAEAAESPAVPAFAFVLAPGPTPVDPGAIAAAHARIAPQAPGLAPEQDEAGDQQGATLRFGDGVGEVVIVSTPHPIPTGEVEQGAEFSVGRFRAGAGPYPRHGGHWTVALSGVPDRPPLQPLVRLTWAVAAATEAAGVLGVYWSNGQVTHEARFFLDLARGLPADGLPLPLWTGVSLARHKGGTSLLSLGIMRQFGLPDLRLTTPEGRGNEGLGVFFDLLAYLVRRGEPLQDGDTVGRTPEEKLRVRYEASPVAAGQRVWRVDLPGGRRR